jgi:hypothetical protein
MRTLGITPLFAAMVLTLGVAAAAHAGPLFFGEGNADAIYSADLDGSNMSGKLFSGGSIPGAVVKLDVANSHVYFSDHSDQKIRRMDFDGSNQTLILSTATSGVSHVRQGFDLDLTNSHIYFAQDDGIYRSDLDGSNVTSVYKLTNIGINALAIDVANQAIFYNDNETETIRSVGFDGFGDTSLFTNQKFIEDIEIDLANGKLYWANTENDVVQRGDTDGTDLETLVSSTEVGNVRGVGLDLANGKVYWSDSDGSPGTISYRNLDGTGTISSFNSPGNAPVDIAIVPEPATAFLVGLGGVLLAIRRKRR